MTDITPPPELVKQWVTEVWHEGTPARLSLSDMHIAGQAATWGADQELEACCEYVYERLKVTTSAHIAQDLRAARRPKPPSLKEQALLAIDTAVADDRLSADVANIVRRALESIDD
jgi:hypothetical protein